jgi:hypothetical protein
MRIQTLAGVLGLALASAASAQTSGSSLTLANAAASPAAPVIVDGVNWRCDTTGACVGVGRGEEQPAARACRRVVARVGAVSAFTWRGTTLSADQLAACNTAA